MGAGVLCCPLVPGTQQTLKKWKKRRICPSNSDSALTKRHSWWKRHTRVPPPEDWNGCRRGPPRPANSAEQTIGLGIRVVLSMLLSPTSQRQAHLVPSPHSPTRSSLLIGSSTQASWYTVPSAPHARPCGNLTWKELVGARTSRAGSLEVLLLPLGQCLGGAGPDLVPAAGARLESSMWAVSSERKDLYK